MPAHVSVASVKIAVTCALNESTKDATGVVPINGNSVVGGGTNGLRHEFELHPNMASRWLLLGFPGQAEINAVLDFFSSAEASTAGARWGHAEPVSPSQALLQLQEIKVHFLLYLQPHLSLSNYLQLNSLDSFVYTLVFIGNLVLD
ncbi:unnamed protein product [Protopolystoma xenopodis]|uniref:Uncharacterized protein n=1 Tax=Protopolystoma xenopodis TaxID=117903 RepID=A0A3S5FEB9_9PLAT|nr:unnamed protein product [Protopolystoma xenopodis]